MTDKDACILPVSAFVIDKTMRNTAKKYEFTYKSLMYERTPIELLDNIYMGDMAKNALFDYLKKHCERPVIDYDEIRTDNFTEHDPGWDIMVGYNKIKVEVKSSIPPHGESMSSIVANRDIKITASHDNGKTWIQPKDLESNIHVQIYFYAHPWKIGPFNSFEELYNDISKDYKNNNPWFVRQINDLLERFSTYCNGITQKTIIFARVFYCYCILDAPFGHEADQPT